MRRQIALVVLIGFAATVLGRAAIVLTSLPPRFQGAVAATVFLAAAALMIDGVVVRESFPRDALDAAAAAAAFFACVQGLDLHETTLPAAMYAGTFLGAASEEVVFRRWLPASLERFAADGWRQRAAIVAIPANSFAVSHLLVQQRFSVERTGRVLLLLFVAALLYSEIVRIGGLGPAIVVHALLNATALEVAATARRPELLTLVLLVAATLVVRSMLGRLGEPAASGSRGPAAMTAGLYAAILAATLAAITGNLHRAPLVAGIGAVWTLYASSMAAGSSINSFTRTRNSTAC